MRVVVLHNAEERLVHGDAKDALAVVAVQQCAAAVAGALARLRHEVIVLAAPGEPGALLEALRRAEPDALFNLVESYQGDALLEPAVGGLLELSGIPFTGGRSLACALCLRKPLAKALLGAAGVMVAPDVVVEPEVAKDDAALDAALAPLVATISFPWIVKPAREDASHGIDAGSVVEDLAAARARVRLVVERWRQPALVEAFVEGRELNVALVGPRDAPVVLPLREIDFSKFPPGRPPLVTYESKWVEGSGDWNGTNVIDAALPDDVADHVRDVALRAWKALSLSGYGRVDLRLAAGRHPIVFEANPNPDLSPDAGFALAWARTGGSYDDLIARLLSLAHAGPAA